MGSAPPVPGQERQQQAAIRGEHHTFAVAVAARHLGLRLLLTSLLVLRTAEPAFAREADVEGRLGCVRSPGPAQPFGSGNDAAALAGAALRVEFGKAGPVGGLGD